MSNKKGSAPPRYDEEFKKGAMALVTEKGMPLKSAAKDLGICKQLAEKDEVIEILKKSVGILSQP